MPGLVPFFILLLAGLLFSKLFNRLHLPWVVALILGGIVVGPHGLNFFTPDPTIEFFAQIGLVFLMFMAGLEIRFSSFRKIGRAGFIIPIVNGLVPFVVGMWLGSLLGLSMPASLLLGIVFLTSSVSVIVPSLESTGLLRTRVGRSVITSSVIEDIVSLVLLSVLLQSTNQFARVPLPLFYIILSVVLVLLRRIVPRVQKFFYTRRKGKDIFEQNVLSVFVILIGTVVIFELLGIHPIVGGFFAGLILSETITSEILKEKLHVLSYGLFIPIFFITIGAQTNIRVLTDIPGAVSITAIIVGAAIFTKFISGWIGAKLSGFSSAESSFVGVAIIPQLTTTLAVIFAGRELNILSQEILTALVGLAIVTTFIAPLLINWFSAKRWARVSPVDS